MRSHMLTVGLIAVVVLASRPATADEWQTKLQSVIRLFDSNALVAVEHGGYVYRHHTQTFKIHAIDKTGAISALAHDEEGPNADGVLMRVSLQDGPYRGAADIPQDLHGPYWTTFINAYPVADGKHLWLGLSYGRRADPKLLEAVKTCFGPVRSPVPVVTNQKRERAQSPVGDEVTPAPKPCPLEIRRAFFPILGRLRA
jgi:hypothetical protein